MQKRTTEEILKETAWLLRRSQARVNRQYSLGAVWYYYLDYALIKIARKEVEKNV